MGRIDERLPLVPEITGHVVDNDPEDIGRTFVRSKRRAAQRKTQRGYRSGSYYFHEIFPYSHCDYFFHSDCLHLKLEPFIRAADTYWSRDCGNTRPQAVDHQPLNPSTESIFNNASLVVSSKQIGVSARQ